MKDPTVLQLHRTNMSKLNSYRRFTTSLSLTHPTHMLNKYCNRYGYNLIRQEQPRLMSTMKRVANTESEASTALPDNSQVMDGNDICSVDNGGGYPSPAHGIVSSTHLCTSRTSAPITFIDNTLRRGGNPTKDPRISAVKRVRLNDSGTTDNSQLMQRSDTNLLSGDNNEYGCDDDDGMRKDTNLSVMPTHRTLNHRSSSYQTHAFHTGERMTAPQFQQGYDNRVGAFQHLQHQSLPSHRVSPHIQPQPDTYSQQNQLMTTPYDQLSSRRPPLPPSSARTSQQRREACSTPSDNNNTNHG